MEAQREDTSSWPILSITPGMGKSGTEQAGLGHRLPSEAGTSMYNYCVSVKGKHLNMKFSR